MVHEAEVFMGKVEEVECLEATHAGWGKCFVNADNHCPAYVGGNNNGTCERLGCGHSFGDHY